MGSAVGYLISASYGSLALSKPGDLPRETDCGSEIVLVDGITTLPGLGVFGPTNSICVSVFGSQLETGSSVLCVSPFAQTSALEADTLEPYPVR